MRISDWSSDVCSSDLINPERIEELAMRFEPVERAAAVPVADQRLGEKVCLAVMFRPGRRMPFDAVPDHLARQGLSRSDTPEYGLRSEERSVGKEWARTCRSRESANQYKKKSQK